MLRGSSPGMDTLGLKFAAVGSNITPDTLLKSLSVFSMLHILLPALWSKLHRLAAAQGWNRLSAEKACLVVHSERRQGSMRSITAQHGVVAAAASFGTLLLSRRDNHVVFMKLICLLYCDT